MTMFAAVPITQMGQGVAYITSGDGTAIPLDEDELSRAFDAIVNGGADLITTGEAAQMLGVSAKTVARILDSGEIPFVRYGAKGNRMVSRRAVSQYRNESQSRGRESLDDMRSAASEGELDRIDLAAYVSRFN